MSRGKIKLNPRVMLTTVILSLIIRVVGIQGPAITRLERTVGRLTENLDELRVEQALLKLKLQEVITSQEVEKDTTDNNMGITTPEELMELAAREHTKTIAVQPSRGSTSSKGGEVITARVTAYAPLDNKSGICAEGDPTITATGAKVRRGIIAVDPKKIPYGSLVYVPGYGEAIAEDTGGALRQYKGVAIDILVDSYEEAMQWGKQEVEVTILRRGR